jgi:GAF domain-containing protein
MYDALVVDTFIKSYEEISPAAILAGQEARSIVDAFSQGTVRSNSPLRDISASASETALLVRQKEKVLKARSEQEALDAVAQGLRPLTPATVVALYKFREQTDDLSCSSAVGDPDGLLTGLSIPLAERITGWVGATQQTAVNSEPALDLASIADNFQPPLRSTLATPVVREGHLLAVLVAYSPKLDGFKEAHRYLLEHLAEALADYLWLSRTSKVQPRIRLLN